MTEERAPRAGGTAVPATRGSTGAQGDVLLSHLSYEERELLHPLAQHGMT